MTSLTVKGTPRVRAYPRVRAGNGATNGERILLHISKTAAGCWEWTGHLTEAGYGRVTIQGSCLYAHRVSYQAFVGPIADGLHIDHLCRNRACVNPAHLEPVTPMVNTHRGMGNVAASQCPSGHVYDEENTYRKCGRRFCRTCRAAYLTAWNAMTPEQRAERKAAGLPVVDMAAALALDSMTLEASA